MPTFTLSTITYADLRRQPAWAAVGDYAEDTDAVLEAVQVDEAGLVPSLPVEVWCLCSALFADGSEHPATAMCRADSSDGPLLWSVWNGKENVALLVPPAPPHVLEISGPAVFAGKFASHVEQVFPVIIEAVPRFATEPEQRRVQVRIDGAR